MKCAIQAGHTRGWLSTRFKRQSSNLVGCFFPADAQLWRLDEAEAMLRGAIENRPGYSSAMTSLGVTLQAKNQASRRTRYLVINVTGG